MNETIDIRKLLEESCDFNYNIAKENCKNGVMSNGDCCWYHSVWQYLRLIDKVSSPEWHIEFYKKAFSKIEKDNIKILISGTADYSLLALIYKFANENNKKIEAYVLDSCKTPLTMCEWFAKKYGFTINTINMSIMDLENTKLKFDLICTDAFLTRFKLDDAKKVIKIWYNSLNNDGIIATTVRVTDNKNGNTDEISLKKKFITDAIDKFKYQITNTNINLSNEEFEIMVKLYVENMKTNVIGNVNEIALCFREKGFSIDNEISQINTTKGEYKETNYYEVLAIKQ